MKLWLIAAMLFLGWRQTTEGIDTVLERAAKVARFAFGGTGHAGVISHGEQDYKSILAHKSALADFEKLYSQGNLQAKCYALVGINKPQPRSLQRVGTTVANFKREGGHDARMHLVRRSFCGRHSANRIWSVLSPGPLEAVSFCAGLYPLSVYAKILLRPR
jgi:hypothetical protein